VQAACPGAQFRTIAKDVSVVRLSGKVFFRTNGLELDFDGSPHAYGLRDQGEEGICNGLAPLAPPCHGKYRGACFGVCESTFAAWSRNSGDPSTLCRHTSSSDNADVSYFNAIGTGRSFEKVHLIGSASLSVLNRRVERQHPGA
jgi:hypothetical protein